MPRLSSGIFSFYFQFLYGFNPTILFSIFSLYTHSSLIISFVILFKYETFYLNMKHFSLSSLSNKSVNAAVFGLFSMTL